MRHYNINHRGNGEFWLHFHLKNAIDWIDVGLPIPHYLLHAAAGAAFVAWQIDGFPRTPKGHAFLNDVIARFTLTLAAERLPYRPYIEERRKSAHVYNGPPVTLRELAKGLDSLPSRWNGYVPTSDSASVDKVFWAIKYKIEQMMKDIGEGTPVPFSTLEEWAVVQFVEIEGKESATIRAKCRSIWKWYDTRGWTIPKRRFEMSRTEAAARASAIKAERARKAVESAVTGLMAETYKKKNGKWNIAKIANDLKMSRDTVRKYLKELTQNA